jgi:hypothetical protein
MTSLVNNGTATGNLFNNEPSFLEMNNLYLWCISGITIAVALNTIWRLIIERDRLTKDDLNEEDRLMAWRIVIFMIFPLLNLLDLRATTTICELLGGYIKSWTYGFLWYQAVPAGLASAQLVIPVVFAGSIVTTLFALCLIPCLLFRPHPFFATLLGYTISFVLALNLIADPLLSLVGMGGLRWQIAFSYGAPDQRMPLMMVHAWLAVIYLLIVRNSHVRLWFSSLSRPQVTAQLRQALSTLRATPLSARLLCSVAILYDGAGMRSKSRELVRQLKGNFPYSPYSYFMEALVAYRRRDYKTARKAFVHTSDYPGIDGELKGSLLGAAACAAFADNDLISAVNLCERALEFDDECVVARMVKVDVFLRQEKKEQAADEILNAMHMGLSLEISNQIPLDIERSYHLLLELEEAKSIRQILQVT